jgi:ABC-type transport system involved in multi-copper enzyme maturation permease subunit
LFIGPVFTREFTITPRRPRIYLARTIYALVLLVLMSTAWLVLTGTQVVRDVGDLARFGTILFQILSPLQLALALFFSALLAASAVAQEKDRHTLDLLLITRLTNGELVLGKLMASLLTVVVLLATSLPLFFITMLFGGVSVDQIIRVFAVTLAGVSVAGSLGSTLALWREKTFQAVAMTVLVLVLWLAVWEIAAAGALGSAWLGLSTKTWAIGFSPWQAILEATRPYLEVDPALGMLQTPVHFFLVVAVALVVLLNGVAIALVRVWNPSRETQPMVREDETWHRQSIWGAEYDAAQEQDVAREKSAAGVETPTATAARELPQAPAPTRHVWDNPIIWREICTWAYGRKILVVRLAYLVLFALAAGSLYGMLQSGEAMTQAQGAMALVPLFLLSLVLVNAQAVTSLTSERDTRAIDLLLVSDLTPKEFIFGKLGGTFYNSKEMIALPMLLCLWLWYEGVMSLGSLGYLLVGLGVLYLFVAMLGVHAGITYANSRSAIATSLGTVFFLFMGVATCMRMMMAFSGSFEAQLPFLGLLIFGGAGLYLALGARNPSPAIGLASFACPLATFYAITSLFLNQPHLVFVAIVVAYGFMVIAMLIPAIDEFDVATGRTTIGEQ